VRLALSLGLPPNSTQLEIINSIAEGFLKKPIPPRVVSDCPAKKNMFKGDKVDLYKLPAPLIHEFDGGPYINTLGCIVVQTPDGSWTHWTLARIMITGSRTMTGVIFSQRNIGKIYDMWKAVGKDMPFSLALGVEPGVVYGSSLIATVNKPEWLGGYFGEPIDLAPCETNVLQIPATAEIVIEGTASITKTVVEGPMGDYTGYSAGTGKMPELHVEAMYYQDDPILPVVSAGVPVDECATVWASNTSAVNLYHLRQAGFPVEHCVHVWDSSMMWMVVTIKQNLKLPPQYASRKDMIDHLSKIIFHDHAGEAFPVIILVENDIDPTDFKQIAWALATRCHPDTGYHFYGDETADPIIPYLQCGEAAAHQTKKVIFDCLFPEDEKRPHVSSFKTLWPKNIQDKVLQRWFEYGFPSGK
jgi:UbiD family decarboxylase